jgi:hypothetical protein
MLPEILGTTGSFFCILILLPFAQRYSRHAAICTVLFFVPILAMPDLHQIHPYYQTANAIFLTAAAGFLIVGLMQGSESHRIGAYAILLVLTGSCLYRYYNSYFPAQQTEFKGLQLVGNEVQRRAKPNQFIVVDGYDWNSEIPFYGQRPAIMRRAGMPKEPIQRQIQAALPATVGDVLYCFDARKEYDGLDSKSRIARVQQEYGIAVTSTSDDGLCAHYFSGPASVTPLENLPTIGTIDIPKDHDSVRGPLQVAGWALSGLPFNGIGISIDGEEAGAAKLGLSRPDLVQPYPQYPGHPLNGYSASLDITRMAKGTHTIRATGILQDGSKHPLGERIFLIP